MNILIADDKSYFRKALKANLSEYLEGLTVIEVSNGTFMAKVVSQRNDIDLLITDYNMPGNKDGEAILEVRKSRPNLPIIVISGMDWMVPKAVRDSCKVVSKDWVTTNMEKFAQLVEKTARKSN